MANRQDRRAAASGAGVGRRTGRVGSGLGAAAAAIRDIRRTAAAHAVGGGFPRPSLELPRYDESWMRLAPALESEMDGDYGEFREALYAEAARVERPGRTREGAPCTFRGTLMLCPVIGEERAILGYVTDPARLSALAASFRRHGVFGPGTSTLILPVPLAVEALGVSGTGPAAVRALAEFAVDTMLAAMSPDADHPVIEEIEAGMAALVETLPLVPGDGGVVSAALAVVHLETAPFGAAGLQASTEGATETDTGKRLDSLRAWWDDRSFRDDHFHVELPDPWGDAAALLASHQAHAALIAERLSDAGSDPADADAPFDTLDLHEDPGTGGLSVTARRADRTFGPVPLAMELAAWSPEAAFGAMYSFSAMLE